MLIGLAIIQMSAAFAQWQKLEGPGYARISSLAKSGPTLFAAGETKGVFVSTDDGENWTATNAGLPASIDSYYALRANGANLFVGTNEGVFVSSDAAANWVSSNTGLPTGVEVYSIFSNNSVLYLGTSDGVYSSVDDGANWSSLSNGLPANVKVRAFTSLGITFFVGTDQGVYLSTDNGTNWVPVNNGLPTNNMILSMAASGTDVFAGTNAGVYRSSTSGTIWTEENTGITASQIFDLRVAGGTIYAGTNAGFFSSTNNGDSWTLRRDAQTPITNAEVNYSAMQPNGTALVVGGSDGISISNDGGSLWTDKNTGLAFVDVNGLATNGSDLFVAAGDGLYTSSDQGSSWERELRYLVSSVKARGSNICIGNNFRNIYATADGGSNWNLATGFGDNGQDVLAMTGSTVFARQNLGPQIIGNGYISTDNGQTFNPDSNPYLLFANNSGSGLFAFDDQVYEYDGTSWAEVSSDVGGEPVYSFAMSEIALLLGTEGGVLLSPINGNFWTKYSFGDPAAQITSLEMDGSNVYACNSNNKVYASTNDGTSWIEVTDNLSDVLIDDRPYGVPASQLVITDEEIYVAGESGIWSRPLDEITAVPTIAQSSQVSLFPNPTNGLVTVQAEGLQAVAVYNVLGELVLEADVIHANQQELNLSGMPRGIYTVSLQSEGQRVTQKIVLQ